MASQRHVYWKDHFIGRFTTQVLTKAEKFKNYRESCLVNGYNCGFITLVVRFTFLWLRRTTVILDLYINDYCPRSIRSKFMRFFVKHELEEVLKFRATRLDPISHSQRPYQISWQRPITHFRRYLSNDPLQTVTDISSKVKFIVYFYKSLQEKPISL